MLDPLDPDRIPSRGGLPGSGSGPDHPATGLHVNRIDPDSWACLVCGTELCGHVWYVVLNCGHVWYVGLNCVGVSVMWD